ncbi:hypothetical protein CEUSTIGMA_g13382.t1 [Chlamydomonas eustigma]|uniref:Uncharacterized protein n=1 Tax=Chlamydomonas eustigma TaxID=1157962 RepID=A0A250XSF6_9CHLO|nr:hypothetical protein CEUSTIGMA_g13382.t1 [Chlamydomonas eustigma]|eukprot:GAX85966.1 hypothetical protein CEUSTIGMA_g13382.t1 [Chlamydomonas eustigma]
MIGVVCRSVKFYSRNKSTVFVKELGQSVHFKSAFNVKAIRTCDETLRSRGLQLESSQLGLVLEQAPNLALPEHQELIAANISILLTYMSAAELKSLLLSKPEVLAVDSMEGWFQFLDQHGFTSSQIIELMSQDPTALVRATLVTAGDALLTMKETGLDEESIKDVVVSFPLVLHTASKEEIVSFIELHSILKSFVKSLSPMQLIMAARRLGIQFP